MNVVRKWDNFVVGFLNKSYLDGEKARAVVGKGAAGTQSSQDRGRFDHFCGLNQFMTLCSDMVMKWSCLCLDSLWSPGD